MSEVKLRASISKLVTSGIGGEASVDVDADAAADNGVADVLLRRVDDFADVGAAVAGAASGRTA